MLRVRCPHHLVRVAVHPYLNNRPRTPLACRMRPGWQMRRLGQAILFVFVFCEMMWMRGAEAIIGGMFLLAAGTLAGAIELLKAEGLL